MASSAIRCPPFDFSAEYYEAAGAGRCVRQSSFFNDKAVLDQGIGYSVILGFGAFFAFFTSFLVSLHSFSSFEILILRIGKFFVIFVTEWFRYGWRIDI